MEDEYKKYLEHILTRAYYQAKEENELDLFSRTSEYLSDKLDKLTSLRAWMESARAGNCFIRPIDILEFLNG